MNSIDKWLSYNFPRFYDSFNSLLGRYIFRSTKNIQHGLESVSLQSTAQYVSKHMRMVRPFSNRFELLGYALDQALKETPKNGLFLEFGVWNGATINFIADKVSAKIHGFDSFEGLPQDWWGGMRKGEFTKKGKLPSVRSNVQLHRGWFDETLPKFLQIDPGAVSFLHIDCDIYASTKTIFDSLGAASRIKVGTIIVFDEYFNYPFWEEHEFKAFQEFIHQNGFSYEYIGYTSTSCRVAVRILSSV
jgi:hypothetical protein